MYASTPEGAASLRMLNVGCGEAFRSDWINIDFHDHGGQVIAYDLNRGIPFADVSFDIVYHSHVLEHFERRRVPFFLSECFRVLRPGGVLRVVVPDLETLAREYLSTLDAVRAGEDGAHARHEWMLIELLDQMTRRHSGGEMLEYWQRQPMPAHDFVLARCGDEVRSALEAMRHNPPVIPSKLSCTPQDDPAFARSGEQHRWMYDTCSLERLLQQVGFSAITRQNFASSLHPAMLASRLDASGHGGARKPDSLYMEAVKQPGAPDEPLRVVSFCTEDGGGAGGAALRQHHALREIGLVSQHYVAMQQSLHTGVHLPPQRGRAQACSETALPAYRQFWASLPDAFKAYTRPAGGETFTYPAACIAPAQLPLLEDADIINLHWVNGMCDPAAVGAQLGTKPLVWTLHDMNAFTGGCHYADGCERYLEHCGMCPQLGSSDEKDLSFQTWRQRMVQYRAMNLHIVSPSHWLATEAQRSALLRRFPVHVIRNAVPVNVFRPLARDAIRAGLGLGAADCVIMYVSQSLSNKRKGVSYVLEALTRMAHTKLASNLVVLLLGASPPAELLATGVRVLPAGHVDDPERLNLLYNAADAILVPSLEDNHPNVIAEAAACGVPTVCFAAGGIPEMVLDKQTGWLAALRDVDGLCAGILWADAMRGQPGVRKRCRAFALEQWNPLERAREYEKLYRTLLPARAQA